MRSLLLARVLPPIALGTAASLSFSACSVTPYAAVVNGTVVSQRSLDSTLSAIAGDGGYAARLGFNGSLRGTAPGTYSSTFASEVLDQQVFFTVVEQLARKKGVRLPSGERKLIAATAESAAGGRKAFSALPPTYRHQLLSEYAAQTGLEAYAGHVDLSVTGAQKYYSSNPAAFSQVCSSTILLGSSAQAASVRKAILAGTSFAAAARKDSLNQPTAAAGGALGCGLPTQYSQVFGPQVGAVLSSAPVGVVSAPIQTSSGWQLFEVTSRHLQTYSQVKPFVQQVQLAATFPAFGAMLQAALAKARVTVNPAYGRWATISGQHHVVPPTPPPPSAYGSLSTPSPAGSLQPGG
ncbi:MAG: peptidylprolyl isomerase [Actinomycetota bacterium]|nr:peptidylprolyl isomerase [Actinomycetota bacterium]